MKTLIIILIALGLQCNTGFLTEHRAFDSVFYYFPERIRQDVHGYVATEDCNDIGKTGVLIVGNNIKFVSVADCLATKDKEKDPSRYDGWVADVDMYLYWGMRIKEHYNKGTLCIIN